MMGNKSGGGGRGGGGGGGGGGANNTGAEVQSVIDALHEQIGGKAVRSQYKPGKRQLQQLQEMGLLQHMPSGFGFSDAARVIAHFQNKSQKWVDPSGPDYG